MPNLPIVAPTVPEGFCNTLGPDWVQQVINLMSQAVAVFDGVGTIVLDQEDQPSPEQRAFLWHEPSTGRIYHWDSTSGAWISPNPEEASGDARRWWSGDLTTLQTYDGGEIGAVGTNSGPMWEEDTAFAGRSPMGPGAIPTSNPAKTLAVNEDYGEGAHTQNAQEVGPHTHPLDSEASITDGDNIKIVNTGGGGPGLMIGLTGSATDDLTVLANKYTTTQQAMSVLHPIRGLFCIKRTIRVNYVGS